MFNNIEMETIFVKDGVLVRRIHFHSDPLMDESLTKGINKSDSVSSFCSELSACSECSLGSDSVKTFMGDMMDDKNKSANGYSGTVKLDKTIVKTFDASAVNSKLMYRRYISPREEVLKIAVNGSSNGFMKELMKEVSLAQREKRTINVGLVYCNSYYQTANDLGDCAINDGLLTYDSLSAYGYKCWLFYDCMKDDCIKSLVNVLKSPAINEVCVYFIGHGTRGRDMTGDESDGYDEMFVFRDGMLRDDKIADEIIRAYPINMSKKKLILISDCCHSGTIFDVSTIRASSKNIPVVSISACQYSQTAKQEWFGFGDISKQESVNGITLPRVYKGNGVFSHYFWKAIRNLNGDSFNWDVDWHALMNTVNGKMKAWSMRGSVE
jgi:hypothetical protein